MSQDGRRIRGERTRQEILDLAVDVASAEGLEGLTIGSLASGLSMSKSGLIAHFKNKRGLQLAAIDHARTIFEKEIVDPTTGLPPGLPRLATLLDRWISYVERSVFRGGCFFAAASLEFDSRPGPVRDQVATLTKAWIDLLEAEAVAARNLGQLGLVAEPRQLIFEAHAMVQEANWAFQLFNDQSAFGRARKGILQRLAFAATDAGRELLRTGEVLR